MRYCGKVVDWKDDRGFGFIVPEGGGIQVFVHITAFGNRQRRPVVGDVVNYESNTDGQGRLQAVRVAFPGERVLSTVLPGRGPASLILATGFLGLLVGLAAINRLPSAIAGLYLIASAVAFAAYAIDKSAARNDRWRTPEAHLHLLALIGGWPGAMMAQRLLRHKSRKTTFRAVFWTTVALNCMVLGWFVSSPVSLTHLWEWTKQALWNLAWPQW